MKKCDMCGRNWNITYIIWIEDNDKKIRKELDLCENHRDRMKYLIRN